jgi:acyl-[acyl-carrier-protein]-phospholipid O-acyltransferase/long-chain-fatty-acid--[acyl-carrier-protein] ligase
MRVAITSVPDQKRGERLVVLHTELPMPKAEILRRLSQAGLPNLYLPGEDSFVPVEAIPVLGTGKLDLKGMADTALQSMALS